MHQNLPVALSCHFINRETSKYPDLQEVIEIRLLYFNRKVSSLLKLVGSITYYFMSNHALHKVSFEDLLDCSDNVLEKEILRIMQRIMSIRNYLSPTYYNYILQKK